MSVALVSFVLAALPLLHGGGDALREELERLGWELTEKQHVPGVGLALVREGKLAWTLGCGFADLAAEREVTGTTVFNIGSISKTVAAWGLMHLVEEGVAGLHAAHDLVLELRIRIDK